MYTVIQSLTADGRDRGLDYKLSGFHVPPGSWDAQVQAWVGSRLQNSGEMPQEALLPSSSGLVDGTAMQVLVPGSRFPARAVAPAGRLRASQHTLPAMYIH
jgi:hypothetical protein